MKHDWSLRSTLIQREHCKEQQLNHKCNIVVMTQGTKTFGLEGAAVEFIQRGT